MAYFASTGDDTSAVPNTSSSGVSAAGQANVEGQNAAEPSVSVLAADVSELKSSVASLLAALNASNWSERKNAQQPKAGKNGKKGNSAYSLLSLICTLRLFYYGPLL